MCFTGYNAKDGPDARWKTAEERKAENEKTESYIVSRYVQDPLLIGGKKFDLRVYVVVTSYRPLRAYASRLGFARFCSVSYSEAKADMDNPFVHLTNGTYCSHRPRRTPRGTLNPKPLSSIHASIIHLTLVYSFIHPFSRHSEERRGLQRVARKQVGDPLTTSVHRGHHGQGGRGYAVPSDRRGHRVLPQVGPERHHKRQAMLRALRVRFYFVYRTGN